MIYIAGLWVVLKSKSSTISLLVFLASLCTVFQSVILIELTCWGLRYCVWLTDADEDTSLSSEGRLLATDHDQFILINIYAPAITTESVAEERMNYKLRWYQVLVFFSLI